MPTIPPEPPAPEVPAAPPVLRTPRLTLRPFRDEDAGALFRIFSDPKVTRYWNRVAWTDPAEARAMIERYRPVDGDRTFLPWAVAGAEDDVVIGTATLFQIDATHRRAEIGYALASAYWGRGLMHEALIVVVGYAFDTLRLHRLEADIDPRNAASLRSVERLGFLREGTLRERWQVGGEISDTAFFGLLAPEWRAGR
ncbi:MAG: GNAT family N-acetyltransferase [Hyphomicrobiales bacterium]